MIVGNTSSTSQQQHSGGVPASAPPQHPHQPAPPPQHYPRQLPMSPQRSGAGSRGRPHRGGRMAQHYANPGALQIMAPSPAHQLLPSSVNSPSLIPQHIPSSFLPQLPVHISPAPRSPQLRVNSPVLQQDNVIMPPHAFKKLTKPHAGLEDEVDGEDGGNLSIGRRNLVSPRQRERRNFPHAALQDHNYCALPPPSPPRSPTPPLSPFP